jgi:SAM-dependent methyltransferase
MTSDSTSKAWDIAAQVYVPEVEADIALLRACQHRFLPLEMPYLSRLAPWCQRAVHLQCSHGFEALALWNLGAAEIVGLDLSSRMLAQARAKADALNAPATWIHGDVLTPQPAWDGTADLLYTGKGALPWVSNLERWAHRCVAWLRPGGRFLLVEAHPLNWVWEHEAPGPLLRPTASYFDRAPRPNTDFPGKAVERLAPSDEPVPTAWEHHWALGAIVTALSHAGLVLDDLVEVPEPFWNQFPNWVPSARGRLPGTFALWMHRPVNAPPQDAPSGSPL